MVSLATFRTSIGKKVLMSVSGVILLGFVIMHLLGNLLIFRGPDALNAYALKLRHLGPWLWVARAILLASAITHVVTSILLAVENRRARPVRYRVSRSVETTLAARTMMLSGCLLLAYLAYHLLQFTFGITNPEVYHLTDAQGRHDVYAMVVLSFRHPAISLAYVLAMGMLCAHLSHGIASAPQSLGLNTERTLPVFEGIGSALAIVLFLGYSAIPLAVLCGLVRLPGRT